MIGIVNECKKAKAPAHAVEAMARALRYQLRYHFAPAWDTKAPSVAVYAHEIDAPDEVDLIVLLDDPDVSDALGYHDVTPTGRPYARVFVTPVLDNKGSWLSGGMSVSSVVSHEGLEMVGDPAAAVWVFDGKKQFVAQEMCDAVESDVYSVKVTVSGHRSSVSVSNFVYPDFFNVLALDSQYDYLGNLKRPFVTGGGGYQIVWPLGTRQPKAVFGASYPAWKRSGFGQFPAARGTKRLFHVAETD
jgi:hypothetical protein